MLDAALEAQAFASDQTQVDVEQDRMLAIDVERVWNTIVVDLPPLTEQLRQILKETSG